jgi:hypothetical protein
MNMFQVGQLDDGASLTSQCLEFQIYGLQDRCRPSSIISNVGPTTAIDGQGCAKLKNIQELNYF